MFQILGPTGGRFVLELDNVLELEVLVTSDGRTVAFWLHAGDIVRLAPVGSA